LLHGESGTGKERLARYIHNVSARRDQTYVAVNCAAIPDNMLEAMLFGYNKGAFTGAVSQQIGKFESANGGTLLLDEISENAQSSKNMSNGIEKREVAVSLQNATAKWNDEITDPTLNNVNVTMKSGQLLAVIGPVGSGKVLII